MKYLLCADLFMIFCVYHSVAIQVKSNGTANFVIKKNTKNLNEKYKNHNMDGWTPIRPTLEYLKLNQRKNCVSVGFYNADCKQSSEKRKTSTKYQSIVDSFKQDYRSPYGNYVAQLVPKLPNHYANAIPRYPQNKKRQFRRFSTNVKRNIELPRFIEEYPTNKFTSRSFQESMTKYGKRHQYPMFEPIPGQILYPPSVPQFISNPLKEIPYLQSRNDDLTFTRKSNIKTFQSTMFPFFEHEAVTKKSSTFNKKRVRNSSELETTSPVFSMVLEPTTIKVSSTISSILSTTKATTIGPPVQYVYSVAMNQSNKNNILNDFEKELPRKVVLELPPKKTPKDDGKNVDANSMISTKLSNRFLEYTTSGYSNYVTIRPSIDRPQKDTTEYTNEIPKISENRIKIIPFLYTEEYSDINSNENSVDETILLPINHGNQNRTYFASNTGFKNMIERHTKKTTLKPLIYTLSSLLLDTDNQSTSHQLSKPGQYYVDHLSSTIINDYVGKTQRTEQPAEAVQASITMKQQPPLPNKSNNQNTTNSRWTQPHELYAINNNDGINDRDQKIKDINLDIVITTDGPTNNRNQIYENKNFSGINDGDEWNDGNVDGNSRALTGYGRVNVEPNIEWIMVAKSSMEEASKIDERKQNSRSVRLASSSYKDYIIPMTKREMPKVNNSNIVIEFFFEEIMERRRTSPESYYSTYIKIKNVLKSKYQ